MVPRSRGHDRKSWRSAIVEVLESAEEPLHYEEVARRVVETGFVTTGQTPEKTVSKELTTNPNLFARVTGGTYQLVEPLAVDAPIAEDERRAIFGQGRQPSAEIRRLIELHAMRSATQYFEQHEWTVTDVSGSQPFDLLCTKSEGVRLSVEVKGTATEGRQVLLTRNEVRHARAHFPRIALYILSRVVIAEDRGSLVATRGTPHVINPWDITDGVLTPVSFSYAPGPIRP